MSSDSSRGVVTQWSHPLQAEIAVIGSGPGGAITACLLAEAGRDVLLIEEGPFLPLESCAAYSRTEMVQKYRNGGITVAMGKPKVAYVEGRCVGGGSEVNAGLYHRTPPEVLDSWRQQFEVEAMDSRDLAAHFEACEKDVSVSYLPGPAPAASLKLHDAAQALGWNSLEVPRWFKYDSGHSSVKGVKQSMTKTYIPRALDAGCRLLPDARVLRLKRQGGKWNLTVSHAPNRGKVSMPQIEAQHVFISAGAVQTPTLLQRSGIGRNIGRTLKMHPTIKIVARFAEPVSDAEMGVPVHQVKEFSPRFSFGCSISSPPYLALAMLDNPDHAREVVDNWTQCAIYYAAISDGIGTVRPVPGFRDPLVRYRLSRQGLVDLSDALRNLGRCLFAARAVALYPTLAGGQAWTRPADIDSLPGMVPASRANLMTIHVFSSCPMGENRKLAAADSFGRVHGADDLYIADGSLLCNAPGVNPQGTIMALARRNALKFLGKL